MTIRTLFPGSPLPDELNLPMLALAVLAVGWTSWRWARADPALLTLWSVSLTIISSGHGFEHDWLWLVFVPVVLRWHVLPTLLVVSIVSLIHGAGFTTTVADRSVVATLLVASAAPAGTRLVLRQERNPAGDSFEPCNSEGNRYRLSEVLGVGEGYLPLGDPEFGSLGRSCVMQHDRRRAGVCLHHLDV